MPVYSRDWMPKVGWTSFRDPFRIDAEEALWERYIGEYEPAQTQRPDNDGWVPTGFASAVAKRAREIAATLASESTNVQLVARWRRHFPTDDWARLERWLSPAEIEKARDRLKALGLLRPPHWIVC